MCGQCCRHLNLSNVYSDLDRGDGTCKFLVGNLCAIYDRRPLKCRIDESYELLFKAEMSKDYYYRLNHEVCKALKKER